MSWSEAFFTLYILSTIIVGIIIIYNTTNVSKALAYLLLLIFVPIIGIIIYLLVGLNYRKEKLYDKKLVLDKAQLKKLESEINRSVQKAHNQNVERIGRFSTLAEMVFNDTGSFLSGANEVTLLQNGEEKFPAVLKAIESAENHIHVEYYIYEDDRIGNKLADKLIEKAEKGVTVRFIYDDYGSRSIRGKFVNRMKKAGIEAYPFYKIYFMAFANRLNYRNHRKVIIIDGEISFIGGINVADDYINYDDEETLYWRDTHMRIIGYGSYYLQHMFINDWNFCSGQSIEPSYHHFPDIQGRSATTLAQTVAAGPDSPRSSILMSTIKAINLAQKEVFITTPYFIPTSSLIDALITAALSGVEVKLLVPGVYDSLLVNSVAQSYFAELLNAGVKIYQYQKGFIHAKTMVCDSKIAIIGTANMDIRSFDLNFEVNTIIYDPSFAIESRTDFMNDLNDAVEINNEEWKNRSVFLNLFERVLRLVSPLL